MNVFGSKPSITGARWLGVANASLPVLLIMIIGSTVFSPGSDNAVKVKGRPPGWFFGVIWSIITILWSLALVVSTMWTQSTLLFVVFQAFSLLTVLCVFGWLVVNSTDKDGGATAQVLAVCTFLSLIMLLIAVITATDDVRTALTLSLTMAPLFSWCSVATLLNFLAINQ